MKFNFSKSIIVLTALVSLLVGCANNTDLLHSEADPIQFLPTSDLPFGVNQLPDPITADQEQLKSSYSIFSVDESSGGDIDYYLEWNDSWDYNLGGRFMNPESTRFRDKATLTIGPPSLWVYRQDDFPGRIFISWPIQFKTGDPNESQLFGIEALCNGILVEVKEEAFKIPSSSPCPSRTYSDTGLDLTNISLMGDEPEERRMLMLMSQNPFVLKVVGVDGKERAFEYSGEKSESTVWSPQDYIRIGLEAEQAVLLGHGY